MQLFFRKYGENKPPLIIAHGLYGSSDNWVTHGKKLSKYFEVYIIDIRNHGNSPHSNEHNYNVIANDIYEFMETQNIKKAVLLGHSMGGKAVMKFAEKYMEKIAALIIVDISPAKYNINSFSNLKISKHKKIIDVLNDNQILNSKTRAEADKICSKYINEPQVRAFILKNLKRNNNNNFEWKLNVDTITKNINNILDEVAINSIIHDFKVLFIKAENSDYILKKDINIIKKIFPKANIITIKNAGHWVHAEQPQVFLNTIINYCFN